MFAKLTILFFKLAFFWATLLILLNNFCSQEAILLTASLLFIFKMFTPSKFSTAKSAFLSLLLLIMFSRKLLNLLFERFATYPLAALSSISLDITILFTSFKSILLLFIILSNFSLETPKSSDAFKTISFSLLCSKRSTLFLSISISFCFSINSCSFFKRLSFMLLIEL